MGGHLWSSHCSNSCVCKDPDSDWRQAREEGPLCHSEGLDKEEEKNSSSKVQCFYVYIIRLRSSGLKEIPCWLALSYTYIHTHTYAHALGSAPQGKTIRLTSAWAVLFKNTAVKLIHSSALSTSSRSRSLSLSWEQWVWGRNTPRHHAHTYTYTCIHTFGLLTVSNPATGLFLDGGRKPEDPEET